jgi:hypothetical protein
LAVISSSPFRKPAVGVVLQGFDDKKRPFLRRGD